MFCHKKQHDGCEGTRKEVSARVKTMSLLRGALYMNNWWADESAGKHLQEPSWQNIKRTRPYGPNLWQTKETNDHTHSAGKASPPQVPWHYMQRLCPSLHFLWGKVPVLGIRELESYDIYHEWGGGTASNTTISFQERRIRVRIMTHQVQCKRRARSTLN